MSKLYIVATPIGNLKDITYRAVETLREVDFILAEDTRVTKKLLSHYEINTTVLSYPADDRKDKIEYFIKLLKDDKNLALVTDAGTPAISDPGSELVSMVRELEDVEVVPVPGPSALVAALSASGLNTSQFLFLGFLPHKKGRETLFKEIAICDRVVVFYESPHRIIKTLEALNKFSPEKPVILARELTKIYEEFLEGMPSELLALLENNPEKVRGEFVVVVAPL